MTMCMLPGPEPVAALCCYPGLEGADSRLRFRKGGSSMGKGMKLVV